MDRCCAGRAPHKLRLGKGGRCEGGHAKSGEPLDLRNLGMRCRGRNLRTEAEEAGTVPFQVSRRMVDECCAGKLPHKLRPGGKR